MSVDQIKFKWPEYDCDVVIDRIDGRIRFVIEQHKALSAFELDHNEADLLRLYLTEHLK